MKKIISVLILVALTAVTAKAQKQNLTGYDNYKDEITLSYGYVSSTQTIYTFANILAGIGVAVGGGKINKIASYGVPYIEYMRHIGNGRNAFGTGLSYEYMMAEFTDKNNNPSRSGLHALCAMAAYKVMWFNRPHCGMYTHLAAGVMGFISNGARILPAFQVDLVGIDFGGERVRGFAEIGFGMQGSIKAGLRTSF